MIGDIMNRNEILSKTETVLPILDDHQYKQAIKLLAHSNEILQFEVDFNLSAVVAKLHYAIDQYLDTSAQAIELEKMCLHFESSLIGQVA